MRLIPQFAGDGIRDFFAAAIHDDGPERAGGAGQLELGVVAELARLPRIGILPALAKDHIKRACRRADPQFVAAADGQRIARFAQAAPERHDTEVGVVRVADLRAGLSKNGGRGRRRGWLRWGRGGPRARGGLGWLCWRRSHVLYYFNPIHLAFHTYVLRSDPAVLAVDAAHLPPTAVRITPGDLKALAHGPAGNAGIAGRWSAADVEIVEGDDRHRLGRRRGRRWRRRRCGRFRGRGRGRHRRWRGGKGCGRRFGCKGWHQGALRRGRLRRLVAGRRTANHQ